MCVHRLKGPWASSGSKVIDLGCAELVPENVYSVPSKGNYVQFKVELRPTRTMALQEIWKIFTAIRQRTAVGSG